MTKLLLLWSVCSRNPCFCASTGTSFLQKQTKCIYSHGRGIQTFSSKACEKIKTLGAWSRTLPPPVINVVAYSMCGHAGGSASWTRIRFPKSNSCSWWFKNTCCRRKFFQGFLSLSLSVSLTSKQSACYFCTTLWLHVDWPSPWLPASLQIYWWGVRVMVCFSL